jgi:hypothetical protein
MPLHSNKLTVEKTILPAVVQFENDISDLIVLLRKEACLTGHPGRHLFTIALRFFLPGMTNCILSFKNIRLPF